MRSRHRFRSLAGDQAPGIVFGERGGLGGAELGEAFADIAEQPGAVHDVERLLERLQVVHAHDHGGGVAVPGYDDAAVLSLHPVHDLGQAVLDVCERHLLGH